MDKIIVFGGSFDPIHKGHLLAAKVAADSLEANVVFVPSKRGFGKKLDASQDDRLAMINLAIKDDPRLSCDTYEFDSLDVSYTAYTLQHIKAAHPEAKVYLLIGADAVNDFHNWYMADDIKKTAKILYFERKGCNINFENVAKYNMFKITSDEISDISSSLFKDTKDFKLLPDAVARYVKEKHLYGC